MDIIYLASSGDDGGSAGLAFFLFAAGPAAGIGIWAYVYNRYRNKSARYKPETEVHSQVTNLVENDQFVKKFQTKRSSIEGNNAQSPHERARISQFEHM